MAHEEKPQAAAPAAAAPHAPAAEEKPSSSKSKLIIALGVLVVTLAECVGAYLYLPAATASNAGPDLSEVTVEDVMQPKAAADDKHGEHGKKAEHGKGDAHAKGDAHGKADDHGKADEHGKGDGHGKSDEHGKHGPVRIAGENHEMDMGQFRVTAFQALSNTTLRVDFHLYGIVADGSDEEFASLLEAKKQRFRDQVITTIRSVDMTDFTEAGLGLIKRRILETTNKTLGKPLLQSVLFSDFSFVEQ